MYKLLMNNYKERPLFCTHETALEEQILKPSSINLEGDGNNMIDHLMQCNSEARIRALYHGAH